jgi:hypothetical protein
MMATARWRRYTWCHGKSATVKQKRLNGAEQHALRAANVMRFTQQYGRKTQRGKEPNDRWLVKDLTQSIK